MLAGGVGTAIAATDDNASAREQHTAAVAKLAPRLGDVATRGEARIAVCIADSADPSLPAYWMTTIDLANWIATRGYSA